MKTIIKSVGERIFQRKGIILLSLLYILVSSLSGIGCIFYWLTGIPCAGCGITRACCSIIQLDFQSAFYYHPLFWLIIPFILYMLLGKRPYFGSDRKETIISVIILALIIGVYIYRVFFMKNSPIGIDFSNSFMLKLIGNIF